ncbi:MAG TPA: D-alanyl-D-alanine carboxypeptidase/D-alanyl-D-alanine-endopeptidase, partial [Phycisphaerales bacterium]|nr:D-alanyl-D-alanine carboxypeptidase/D-alanyl-D-alanine-endopeptidase [Phycisphaerales bacterium]
MASIRPGCESRWVHRASRGCMVATPLVRGLIVLFAMVVVSAHAAAQDLASDMRRLMNSAKVGQSRIGVSIVDTATGEVLFSSRSSEALIPASNMKILTSAAALWTLGPEWVYRTELREVDGRLILVGSGDPALADPELLNRTEPRLTVEDFLTILSESVRKAGILDVTEVVLDDRVFDRAYIHPSWPENQLDKWYCAQVSGINFHANVLAFYPRPSQGGVAQAPTVRVQPSAPWIDIENRARTINGDRNTVSVLRTPDPYRFRLAGEVAVPSVVPIEVSVSRPTELFGRMLADRVRQAGVSLPESQGAVRLVRMDEDFPRGRTIAVVTTPLADVLKRCNTDSYNLYAESLLKSIGHRATNTPGSWENGGKVMLMLLSEKLGPGYAASTRVADGSGMSRENAVSPDTITRWLTVISRDRTIADAFIASLAKPGEGTLKRRFQGARLRCDVRAKSGYINRVRSLSGYVTHRDTGERLAVSFIANDIPGDVHGNVFDLAEDVFKTVDPHL